MFAFEDCDAYAEVPPRPFKAAGEHAEAWRSVAEAQYVGAQRQAAQHAHRWSAIDDEGSCDAPARLPSQVTWSKDGALPVPAAVSDSGAAPAPVARPRLASTLRGPRSPQRPSPPSTATAASPTTTTTTPLRRSGSPVQNPPRAMGRPDVARGDVSLCVRLRPGANDDATIAVADEAASCVHLRPNAASRASPIAPNDVNDGVYPCDIVFGPDTTQEHLYDRAVDPICEAVLRGYNGAVIAYGQTGSGKTHTMLGHLRGVKKGVTPRAVDRIFATLARCQGQWNVEVSVLEIYNERVRDLLHTGPGVQHVEVHEAMTECGSGMSFQCPDAIRKQATCRDEALEALHEGMRRRETARTDMNHNSSRSHLIFTLCVTQTDREAGATIRGRLHLVDLAGSERLKRSMASDAPSMFSSRPGSVRQMLSPRSPRDQVREACEINKSLAQLALVIQRLTTTTAGAPSYAPYRDSMLTRLLAESFGGSSKTTLIINCSAHTDDREETKSSLEFGRRAKLVKNKAVVNIDVQHEPSMVFRALVAREVETLQRERDGLFAERAKLEEAVAQARAEAAQARQAQEATDRVEALRAEDAAHFEQERQELEQRAASAESELAQVREASSQRLAKFDAECAKLSGELQNAHSERQALQEELKSQARSFDSERAGLRAELEESVAQSKAYLTRIREEHARDAGTKAADIERLRKSHRELSNMLEAKTSEVSKLVTENGDLQQRLQEEACRRGREQATWAARMEADRLLVHQQWNEAASEVYRLLQDRAPLLLQSDGAQGQDSARSMQFTAARPQIEAIPHSVLQSSAPPSTNEQGPQTRQPMVEPRQQTQLSHESTRLTARPQSIAYAEQSSELSETSISAETSQVDSSDASPPLPCWELQRVDGRAGCIPKRSQPHSSRSPELDAAAEAMAACDGSRSNTFGTEGGIEQGSVAARDAEEEKDEEDEENHSGGDGHVSGAEAFERRPVSKARYLCKSEASTASLGSASTDAGRITSFMSHSDCHGDGRADHTLPQSRLWAPEPREGATRDA